MREWAINAYEEELLEEERQFYIEQLPQMPDIPMSYVFAAVERGAVEKARRGDFHELAGLINPDNPLNRYGHGGHGIRDTLGADTWRLLQAKLTGAHKVPRGKPKQRADQRRENTPTHEAADAIHRFERILRTGFPDQKRREIKTRAIEISAAYFNVKEGTLRTYIARSRRAPHRL